VTTEIALYGGSRERARRDRAESASWQFTFSLITAGNLQL
jgi:hypothetical protein